MSAVVTRHRLEDLAMLVDYGVTASAKNTSIGPLFLRITDIQDDSVDWSTVPFCDINPTEEESARLAPGDIVFARTGATTGKSYLLRTCPKRAVFASYLIRVRPKQSSVEPRYLAWYFQTPEYWQQITSSAAGSAQPGVNASKLKALTVPLPSFPEQRRIADILDKADAIRRKRKQAITLTDQLLRSTFLEMFGDPVTNPKGWPVRRLGDVSILYSGNSLPPGEEYRGQQNGTLLLKVGDMNLPGNEKAIHVAREWSPSTSGCVIAPAGSIIFPKRGGAISTNKKRYLVREVALDPNLMAVSPSEEISTEFLLGWFDLMDLDTISNGSTVPQLNKKDISPLKVFVPPKNTQQTYSVFCMRMAALNRTLAQSLAESERLFESLVDRAFRGELSRTEQVAGQLSMFNK